MGCLSSKEDGAPGAGANSPQTANPVSNKSAAADTKKDNSANKACFGAGCYWGTEKFLFHDFNKKDTNDGGKIVRGAVGFMGPAEAPASPTYKDVCTGRTGHVEVYDCEFTGGLEFYEKMVRYFFQFHDPTIMNCQGNDKGTQYASVIYCYTEEQAAIANKVIKELQELLDGGKIKPYIESNVLCDVRRSSVFYLAQKEHQDYLENNPNGYCNHRIRFKEWPKVFKDRWEE
jgi:peptide-methionine (S)-S-oxide reductase